MLIFIDESGDPGFKITEGSSQHFVIALIIFQNELDAEETAVAIKKMRKVQKHTDQFEYKFNKCDRKHRLSFLKCVQPFNFAIRAIVFDKTNIRSQHLRTKKEDFYRFALRMVLEHNYGTIKNAKIRLDGRGDHSFRRQLTTYLRQHLNSSTQHVISNLRFRDSKQDVLIQLADMVAGSLRRYFDHTQENWGIYRKVLISKENDVWEFT